MESILNPDELADYGLSNYEAKVYYAILPSGAMTAKEISDLSNIPFGRIYDTLGKLEEKGVIESQDSRPKKYSAKNPRDALKNLIDAKDRDLIRIKDAAPTIEEKLAQMYNNQSNESLFWNVYTNQDVIAKHEQKILESQEELLIFLNEPFTMDNHEDKMKFFLNSLQDIVSRGVDVKVLFGGINEVDFNKNISRIPREFFELLEKVEIRVANITTNTFDVIDKEKVIIKITNPVLKTEYLALIYLWQTSFATEMRKLFFESWNGAKKPIINLKFVNSE